MAKRFTDTEKFIDPWYRRLTTKNKILWEWLLCNCDHAGIITIDFEFIEMVLNEKYEDDVIEKFFSERTVQIGICKYFIPKFLRFQYGKLNPASKVHASVIARLKEEGILYAENDSIKDIENNARFIGYPKSMDTTKEKEKNKDKVKDKENNNTKLVNTNPSSPNLTPDEIVDAWNSHMGKEFGYCPGLGGGKHLHNCLEAIEYLKTIPEWENLFSRVRQSKFLTGQSETEWTVTLTWLVNYDNALRVLSDEFNEEKITKNIFSKIDDSEASA